jgi:hypothetical protein
LAVVPPRAYSALASGYGKGLNKTPSTMAKTVVESAMLSAMTPMIVIEYHGAWRRERSDWRRLPDATTMWYLAIAMRTSS